MPDSRSRTLITGNGSDLAADAVARFEQGWLAGDRPAIERLLPTDPTARLQVVPTLVRLELEYRLNAGEPARVEDYLARFPELALEPDVLLGLVRLEHRVRLRHGTVPPGEFAERFPHLYEPTSDHPPDLTSVGDTSADGAAQRAAAVSHDTSLEPVFIGAQAPTLGYEPPTQPDQPPPMLRGYDLLGELGRGGMGVVYKARHLNLNRIVALKIVLGGAHAGTLDLVRFRQEAELVARLDHPNIVQIYDVGAQDGNSYLALEYIEGGTLSKRLGGSPQPPPAAAVLVELLARAMHYAHTKGVIHRDLKPSNILLAEDGLPKITDFGLARRVEEDSGLTRTGAVMGTPSYMSPEQATGQKDVGVATDVYALGATLYDLLTGRPPFKASTVPDTIHQVRHLDPVPPRRLQPTIPRDLQTICLKCLRKDPGQRYATALALAEDLHRFLADEPIRARPPSWLTRVDKAMRRNRAAVGGAAVAAFLLLAILGGVLWSNERSKQKRVNALVAEAEQQLDLGVAASDEDADRYFEEALQRFASARALDRRSTTAGDGLARVYLLRCRRALDRGDYGAARVLLLPLKDQDRDGRHSEEIADLERRVLGRGSWRLATTPAGADVVLTRLDADLLPGKPVTLGKTPLDLADVAPGSYVAEITSRDHAPLVVPLIWDRAEAKATTLTLIPSDRVPDGMVFVPGGKCVLGDPSAGTQRVVEVADFFIDRTEVTGAEYEKFVKATGARHPDRWPGPVCPPDLRDQAVYNVSWFEAVEYARWAGKRLPTEAEWEKAARGADGRHFPWGNKFDPARANFRDSPREGLHAGRKRRGASPYGVLDLAGNVWEWTLDREKRGEADRVIRGGAAYSTADELLAYRRKGAPLGGSSYGGSNLLGFRCVKPLHQEPAKPDLLDELAPGDLAVAAEFYWDQERFKLTRACADRLRELNPRSVAGNFWLGMCHEQDGKPADALAALKKAFIQYPAYRTRGRSARAELLRMMASARTPPDRAFLDVMQTFSRAQQAMESRRFADAEVELKKVLADDPDHPFAHEQLADICDALNRPTDAAEHRKKRVEAYRLELLEAPDNAELHHEFAEFIAHNDFDLAEGLRLAQRAVELEPLEPRYRAQAAEFLARSGRWPEAVAEITKAVEQSPEHDAYREALRAYQASRAGVGKKK